MTNIWCKKSFILILPLHKNTTANKNHPYKTTTKKPQLPKKQIYKIKKYDLNISLKFG